MYIQALIGFIWLIVPLLLLGLLPKLVVRSLGYFFLLFYELPVEVDVGIMCPPLLGLEWVVAGFGVVILVVSSCFPRLL